MRPGWALILAGLLAAGWLAACGGEPPAPWRVEVAGCETWTAAPACALGEDGGALRIWVAGEDAAELRLDGKPLAIAGEEAEGGLFYAVPVPAGARRLGLHRPPQQDFELVLVPSVQPEGFAEMRALARSTDPQDQARALELLARQPNVNPAWKLYLQARSAQWSGRRVEATTLARQAERLWQETGLPLYRMNELIFASHMAGTDGDYKECRRLLEQAIELIDSLAAWPARPVRLHFLADHQRAVLAYQTGDVRTALASLDTLTAFERRQLLDPVELSDLHQLKANVLAELGRFDEAIRELDGLLGLEARPEQRASREINRGWVTLLARQAGQSTEDPSPHFRRAWDYYREKGEGHQKLNSLINLAAAALQERRLEDARDLLGQARSFHDQANAHEGFMFDWLEARLLLARGEPQAALERFHQLDLEASRRHLPAAQWQALVGKAEAMAALGQRTAAAEAFARAESLENRELIIIPLDGGRETFLAQRERTTRQHLDLLLADGRSDDALELVRRRRIQPLTLLQRDERVAALGPADRQAWEEAAGAYRRQADAAEASREPAEPQASRAGAAAEGGGDPRLEALIDAALARLGLPDPQAARPPSRPGELTLAFFPRESAWLVFALDEQGLEIQQVEAPPGTALEAVAPALLAKVAPRIEASRRLRILPWGGLDLHAVDFGGAPLLAAKPVVYGVDAGSAVPAPAAPRRALLVADSSRLRWAQAEIELAQEVLGRRPGLTVEPLLEGRDAAAAVVRDGLERVDFFHFAGHGEFDPAGSQSRLILAGGDLKAADVLTLRRVPAQVLLSSCYVGRPARAAGIEGLGLAYAFVLTGARQVLAATRQVDDRETALLIRLLYEKIAAEPDEIDLAVALQEAQLELREKGGDAWKAFRVFEP